MMTQDTVYILLLGLLVSMLPLWIGYRRKISIVPMVLIMVIGGLVPLAGWIIGLYIACRAKSRVQKTTETQLDHNAL